MSYDQYRTTLIEAYYQNQLETLMSGYRPDRPTVILLPGIMGSQLERTNKPYPEGDAVINDIIWMDLGIAWPKLDGKSLEIDQQGEDIGSFVVAAYGPLSFATQTPYNELRDLARAPAQDWNYAVFGYDWRRPLTESSGYFKTFVRDFRQRVIDHFGAKNDPIPNLTVVCHSMGGLVATDALRDQNFSGLGFSAVATIGTPFYGSAAAQNAFYVGMPGVLNGMYKAATMVRLVSSFPGAYSLMFLPKSIYRRDGRKIGLTRYPEYDPNGNGDLDPYDSSPTVMRRWPKDVKDHRQYLLDARQQLENISGPINANVAPAFFNVRSSLDQTTPVEILWNDVDGDDNVPGTSPSPLAGVAGGGDGTVPFWSAFHAYCRTGNRYELKQAKDHATLLEHPEVLSLIASIVKKRKKLSKAPTRGVAPARASKKKLAAVVADWTKRTESGKAPPPELFQKPVLRAMFSELLNGPKPPMLKGGAKRSKPRK
jgi:pimeloyl-ACP methyl ester carboxylesterase